jgi:hypothetical protein
MKKLTEVQEATALMTRGMEWGVWRWLFEKGRVRAASDRAVDALSELERKVKASWGEDLKKAYRELQTEASADGDSRRRRQYEKAKEEAKDIDPEIKRAVERVKAADDKAYQARMDAEATFDEAERRLSADMARRGAEKAINSWELRETAIRKAEALARRG